MKENKVLVIGGGASGLIAAISAARMGADVTLIEKLDKLGKKILATGNGRCNFTNVQSDYSFYRGGDDTFVSDVLKKFNNDNTISFFEELGIFHKVESEGRVYPYSEEAVAIQNVLIMEINRLDIEIVLDNYVKRIEKKGQRFFVYTQKGEIYKPDKVIIAAGGKAAPHFGCQGDGYDFAEKLGHSLIEPKPGLVKLITKENMKDLKGVRSKGAVEVINNKKSLCREIGEIQFTQDGLSGICVFNISTYVHQVLEKKKECTVKIDLFPEYSLEDLKIILQMRKSYSGNKTIEEFLVGLVKNKLISYLLNNIAISSTKKTCDQLTRNELDRLLYLMKNWEFTVTDTYKWKDAQVTTGGINLNEVDSQTMESKVVSGLYFAGEILDVDGICGGYNLQWAWSTGNIAGINATK